MCKTYEIDEEMIHSMVEELLREDTLSGKISQGQFIPSVFQKNQEKITKRFFS